MQRQRQTLGFLLAGLPAAFAAVPVLIATVLAAIGCLLVVGIPVLSELLRATRALSNMERQRAGLLLPEPVPRVGDTAEGGPLRRLGTLTREAMTYREIGWLTIHGMLGVPLAGAFIAGWTMGVIGLIAGLGWWALPPGELTFFTAVTSWPTALPMIGMGLVCLATCWWLFPLLAKGYTRWCHKLLTPSTQAQLSQRVEQLSVTRAGALDAHASELRRIERDLHDGVQARLVSVGIQLGVAQQQRDDAPGKSEELVGRARDGVEDALAELQHVVRGVFPPILADRGLVGAIQALAGDSAVPLTVDIESLESLPASVESAAYFVVAEGLTNIARHSAATRADLCVARDGDMLTVRLTDDGHGGADENRGTGIRGIRQRTQALDGTTELSSPSGGPTLLQVTLPCEC